jgi:hypothetical protein
MGHQSSSVLHQNESETVHGPPGSTGILRKFRAGLEAQAPVLNHCVDVSLHRILVPVQDSLDRPPSRKKMYYEIDGFFREVAVSSFFVVWRTGRICVGLLYHLLPPVTDYGTGSTWGYEVIVPGAAHDCCF